MELRIELRRFNRVKLEELIEIKTGWIALTDRCPTVRWNLQNHPKQRSLWSNARERALWSTAIGRENWDELAYGGRPPRCVKSMIARQRVTPFGRWTVVTDPHCSSSRSLAQEADSTLNRPQKKIADEPKRTEPFFCWIITSRTEISWKKNAEVTVTQPKLASVKWQFATHNHHKLWHRFFSLSLDGLTLLLRSV